MSTARTSSVWRCAAAFPLIFGLIQETWATEASADAAAGYRYRVDVDQALVDPIESTGKLNINISLEAKFDFPPGFSYGPALSTTPSSFLGYGYSGSSMMKLISPRRMGDTEEYIFTMYTLPHQHTSCAESPSVYFTPFQRSYFESETALLPQTLCSATGRMVLATWFLFNPGSPKVFDFLSQWLNQV
ncbi:hypothetical protein DFP72DRAFT_234288 [Ephemerocybe angulata]|uniref:Uncharacterized protein n=1 Tax=Ephemerocybe angulata TaxID=980116 RepID=A0A8H6I1Z3_9AGAR|nr:hypothetical protein DFP72DRAFT_234288 [Tulosesus angulatus]